LMDSAIFPIVRTQSPSHLNCTQIHLSVAKFSKKEKRFKKCQF
jgi:hypothetical protein